MEVYRIFKRIQNLEMTIKQLINENERLCYNLIILDKVKNLQTLAPELKLRWILIIFVYFTLSNTIYNLYNF